MRKKYDLQLLISVASHKEELVNEIKRQFESVPEWIELLPPTNDISKYYQKADFFLSPSRSEGFCYAIVEAAFCGCSIIASDIPAQLELAVENIYYFKSDNVDEYIISIEKAVANLDSDNKTKERLSLNLEDRYSIENWSLNIFNLLLECKSI